MPGKSSFEYATGPDSKERVLMTGVDSDGRIRTRDSTEDHSAYMDLSRLA